MERANTQPTSPRPWFAVFLLLIAMSLAGASWAATPEQWIEEGETALFEETVDGALQAYELFQNAAAEHPDHPVIHAYLAVTRFLDLALREDGTGLVHLLEQYGVTRVGRYAEALDLEPTRLGGEVVLPESAPGGEAIRSFLAGTMLGTLNACVADLDKTLAAWSEADKYVIPKERLGIDLDIEVDTGDIHLLRSFFESLRFLFLVTTAYDWNADLREVVASGNAGLFNPSEFLSRFANFLQLLPTQTTPAPDGSAMLIQAKGALSNAVESYLTASQAVVNDPGTEPGAEELLVLGDCDLRSEAWVRESLLLLKDALAQGTDVVFTQDVETWMISNPSSGVTVTLRKGRSEGDVQIDGYGTGNVECVVVNGDQLSMRLTAPSVDLTYQGTLNNDQTQMQGTYTGWVSGGEVSGAFTGTRTLVETETLPIGLNAFFGTGSSPQDLRDFLPAFNCDGEPVRGTMGQNLASGPDPTLGGLLPDLTQEDWELEGLDAAGEISIPQTSALSVQDGTIGDWSGIAPVFQDALGDGNPDIPGADLQDLYLARDADFLYVRMTLDALSQGTYQHHVHFRGLESWVSGVSSMWAGYGYDDTWRVNVYDPRDNRVGFDSAEIQAIGRDLEFRVPLSELGDPTGRFLSTFATSFYDSFDENDTCLRIGPLTSLTVNLGVPRHDGTGPVFVGVFRYEGTLEMQEQNLLARSVVYPGDYTPGMALSLEGLPAGEEVFVAVLWDADYTGFPTAADDAATSGPLLPAPDGGSTVSVSVDTRYAQGIEGRPFFEWCSVLAENTSEGLATALSSAVQDPDGSIPQTLASLEVTGPDGFSYTFSRADFLDSHKAYFRRLSGAPAAGEYTFTATDDQGHQATTHFHLAAGETIPLPDSASLQASGDPLAPVLSWSAVNGYEGNLFYRARIFDAATYDIAWTSGVTRNTLVTVPQGRLLQEKDYLWRVEVFDEYTYIASNRRALSASVPLSADGTSPMFETVSLYRVLEPGNDWTALVAYVRDPNGSVPDSIQAVTVTGPGGTPLATLGYLPDWQMYWGILDDPPAPGIYRFDVTDAEGKTAHSYDPVAQVSVPVVQADTMQASGDPLAPTLSWGVPESPTGPLYFRVVILDDQGNWVWDSGRDSTTEITVPPGLLDENKSYTWWVRGSDSRRWAHLNTESRSEGKALQVQDQAPWFGWAAALSQRTADGISLAFDISLTDPDGQVPDSLQSLTVTGPNGFTLDMLNHDGTQFFAPSTEVWLELPRVPDPGVYTFTAVDDQGNTAVTRDWLGSTTPPPRVDAGTIEVTGDPTAPTVSWQGVPGYAGRPYYRLRVYDDAGRTLYRSGRNPETVHTLPGGIIQPDRWYTFRVETHDHPDWVTYNTRSLSDRIWWEAGDPALPSTIYGRVTDVNGRPIEGGMVLAYNQRCGQASVAWAVTGGNGEYAMSVYGADRAYVQAIPVIYGVTANLPVREEWYDGQDGSFNCNDAASLDLLGNRVHTGIDFSLQTLPDRVWFFEVLVADGILGGGFSTTPGFRDRLVSATLTLPNPARGGPYTFDLEADRFVWDSECRYLDGWWHNFGLLDAADYGEYTLVLAFEDGTRQTAAWTLDPAVVEAVDESSIAVAVNDDGSAAVEWARPYATNQYYQVRVREHDTGKEVARSGSFFNVDHALLSARDLACLELGETYRWQVRAYDDVWPRYNAYKVRWITAPYSPQSLSDRVQWWEVMAADGSLEINFGLRPGSRADVTGANVTGPNGFAYTFDLEKDGFDLSTETRLSLKGWYHRFDLNPGSYGTYTLSVDFEDGNTESFERTLNDVPVVPVSGETMSEQVLPDGSVFLSWGLPNAANPQEYEVRVRSRDGSKEYYRSYRGLDVTYDHIHYSGLRGLEPGLYYQWFVRAYDPNGNTREQGPSRFFLYAPYGGGRVFDLEEAVWVLQVLAGWPSGAPLLGGDLDGDGHVGLADAVGILQDVAGLR